jgi:hypothetical protein
MNEFQIDLIGLCVAGTLGIGCSSGLPADNGTGGVASGGTVATGGTRA